MEPDTDQTRKFPAAAGGDHRVQLAHLKAHLKFQKQDRCDRAKISWNTTITRAQSRRHITLELNEKINSKTPGFHRPGKVNTPDGQRKLQSFASHARTGIFHGGDGNVRLPWRLRYRMYRAQKPQLCNHAFREIEDERPSPGYPGRRKNSLSSSGTNWPSGRKPAASSGSREPIPGTTGTQSSSRSIPAG